MKALGGIFVFLALMMLSFYYWTGHSAKPDWANYWAGNIGKDFSEFQPMGRPFDIHSKPQLKPLDWSGSLNFETAGYSEAVGEFTALFSYDRKHLHSVLIVADPIEDCSPETIFKETGVRGTVESEAVNDHVSYSLYCAPKEGGGFHLTASIAESAINKFKVENPLKKLNENEKPELTLGYSCVNQMVLSIAMAGSAPDPQAVWNLYLNGVNKIFDEMIAAYQPLSSSDQTYISDIRAACTDKESAMKSIELGLKAQP